MNRALTLAAGIALAGLLAWGAVWLFPSEQKRIQKRLNSLAATATFTGREGNLARLANAANLAGFFTADTQIVIEIPNFGTRVFGDRDEVQQTALAALASGRGVKVEFFDINVQLAPDKQSAAADLTAKVTLTGDRDFGVQELRLQLKKADSGWLIAKVQTVRTFNP